MMKKILFVTTGLAVGGAETQLVRMALRLRQRGWDVQVVSMLPPVAYTDTLQAAGISVHNLRMRRKIPDIRALARLARIVKLWQPTVVHAFMIHANLLARVCRIIRPVPVLVCSAHSINEGGGWREWAYRITDPLCDLTTHVCQAGVERYSERRIAPRSKLLYFPNGIETERFIPNPERRIAVRQQLGLEDAFVWLAVGRLEPPKDYPNLLNAVERLRQQTPQPFRVLIAGDGALHPVIAEIIRQKQLEPHVSLLGLRSDIPHLLSAADAYVMSSAWEGLPMVLLEAAATGLPIVATDVGGNSEIVLHEQTGILTPPHDADALAHAMLRIMNLSPQQRVMFGQAGRAHVLANFDLERIVDRWEQLYNQLLERKTGKPIGK